MSTLSRDNPLYKDIVYSMFYVLIIALVEQVYYFQYSSYIIYIFSSGSIQFWKTAKGDIAQQLVIR